MVYKRLLEAERQDPTVELPCILSLTTNKLSIYSKATNVLFRNVRAVDTRLTASIAFRGLITRLWGLYKLC